MNNKLKILLIAAEVFVLVVLVLVGIGYQQKWIITTGDGPRFDWYAIGESLTVDIDKIPGLPNKPGKSPEQESESTDDIDPPVTSSPAPAIPNTQPGESEEAVEPDAPETTTEELWGMGRY